MANGDRRAAARRGFLLVAALLACGADAARGEDELPAEATVGTRRAIEEIVVTARRRDERLEDVPVSVTALSADDLVNRNISSPQGLQMATPGLVYQNGVSYAMPFIRGIGSNVFSPAVDPSVASFIDGVYHPSAVSALQHLGNVERIEVLKGPQGTLFGRNTTAGAIVVTTRDPGPEWRGNLSVGTGSRERKALSAYVAGPLPYADRIRFGIAAYSDQQDDAVRNVHPGVPGPRDTIDRGLHAKLVFEPLDWLELRSDYSLTKHEGANGSNVQAEEIGALTAAAGGEPQRTPRLVDLNEDGFSNPDVSSVNLKSTATFDLLRFWVLAARQRVGAEAALDLDATNADFIAAFVPEDGYFVDSDSVELQASSPSALPVFGLPLQWLGGFYLFDGSAGWDPIRVVVHGAPVDSILGNGTDLSSFADPRVTAEVRGVVDTTAYGAFGNFGLDLFDWLTLDFGARYSNEKRTIAKAFVQVFPEDLALPPGAPLPPITLPGVGAYDPAVGEGIVLRDAPPADATFDDVSLLGGLNFRFFDTLQYVKYSEGFKSGTWNVTELRNDPNVVGPEKIRSLEAGIKGAVFDERLRFSTAGFWYDYTNLQIYYITLSDSGTAQVENAPAAQILGVDLDVTYMLLDSWTARLGGTYLDAKFTDYPNGAAYDPETYASREEDFAGNRLIAAPKWSGMAELAYSFPIFADRGETSLGYYYNHGYFFDPQNLFHQDAYSLIEARLTYAKEEWGLKGSIVGNNLTDEDYRQFGIVNELGKSTSYAAPREWALRIDWVF